MPLMGADTADQRAMESMRQTTIIIVAAATNKLLFISGFSAFSGFSGLAISKPLRNSSRTNRVRRELWEFDDCWAADAADTR